MDYLNIIACQVLSKFKCVVAILGGACKCGKIILFIGFFIFSSIAFAEINVPRAQDDYTLFAFGDERVSISNSNMPELQALSPEEMESTEGKIIPLLLAGAVINSVTASMMDIGVQMVEYAASNKASLEGFKVDQGRVTQSAAIGAVFGTVGASVKAAVALQKADIIFDSPGQLLAYNATAVLLSASKR